MAWRRHHYGSAKQNPRKNRRIKQLDEQLAELDAAHSNLGTLLNAITAGYVPLVGLLAAELRALVYWNGFTYSPLLLRLAGRLDLPLPIYHVPATGAPPVVQEAVLRINSQAPSLERYFGGHVLVDLQDWLSEVVVAGKFNRSSPANQDQEDDQLTAKALLLDMATTMGSAHYDEDVPDTLDAVQRIRMFETDALTGFLIKCGVVVHGLCGYVLRKASARSTKG
jgi:hypothetical protein